jgi:hypothetical protein
MFIIIIIISEPLFILKGAAKKKEKLRLNLPMSNCPFTSPKMAEEAPKIN